MKGGVDRPILAAIAPDTLAEALRKAATAAAAEHRRALAEVLILAADTITQQAELLDAYRVLVGLEEASTRSVIIGAGRGDIYHRKGEAYAEVVDQEGFLQDLVGGEVKGPVEPGGPPVQHLAEAPRSPRSARTIHPARGAS